MIKNDAAKPISKKRKLLFKTIGILLPLLVLFLIEVSLRVFGYGNNLDLFIESSPGLGPCQFNGLLLLVIERFGFGCNKEDGFSVFGYEFTASAGENSVFGKRTGVCLNHHFL